jgi:predicted MFS family arabinose efflux permease
MQALAVMIAYSLLGNSAMAVQPMVVGGLVDLLGFTERQAGFIAAGEMGGFASGMLLLSRYITKLDRRTLAVIAVSWMIAANVLSVFVGEFSQMLPLRFASGLGASMAYSVFLTMAAGSTLPERSFAVVNATSIAATGIFQWVAPQILLRWQLPGIFLLIVGLALLVVLFAAAIPRTLARGVVNSAAKSIAPTRRDKRIVALVLLTMFALYTGHGAIWTYQERIGVEMGMAQQDVGRMLGMSMLVWGVLGSLLAHFSGLRLGRVWPQVLSLGLSIVAALWLVLTDTPMGFTIACALVALTWFYGLPYQMGLLAQFDRQGRANLLGSMATTGGATAGPALAALLIGGSGHIAIGLLAGVCYLLALICVLPPALALTRQPETVANEEVSNVA